MKIGTGKPFFDQKNRPYIFISLVISRNRCYIGPSDLNIGTPLSRGSGAINGDLGREVDGRWRSKGSPPNKHAQGSDRTPPVLKYLPWTAPPS